MTADFNPDDPELLRRYQSRLKAAHMLHAAYANGGGVAGIAEIFPVMLDLAHREGAMSDDERRIMLAMLAHHGIVALDDPPG